MTQEANSQIHNSKTNLKNRNIVIWLSLLGGIVSYFRSPSAGSIHSLAALLYDIGYTLGGIAAPWLLGLLIALPVYVIRLAIKRKVKFLELLFKITLWTSAIWLLFNVLVIKTHLEYVAMKERQQALKGNAASSGVSP